jgi:hypothetical protein
LNYHFGKQGFGFPPQKNTHVNAFLDIHLPNSKTLLYVAEVLGWLGLNFSPTSQKDEIHVD